MSAVQLNEDLIYRAKRRPRKGGLSDEDRIAINLLWRRGVRVSILAEVFKVSRNTIYYKSLTGKADSYPNSNRSNSAADTNALIDRMGVAAAERQYLTDAIVGAVNEANAREVERRQRA